MASLVREIGGKRQVAGAELLFAELSRDDPQLNLGLQCFVTLSVVAVLSAPAFAGQHFWLERIVKMRPGSILPNGP